MPDISKNNQEELEKIEVEKDAAFKAAIQKIKEAEESGELKSVNLRDTEYGGGVNVEELTREDRKMWEKVEGGTPYEGEFREEYAQYKAAMEKDIEKNKEKEGYKYSSRQNFYGYLSNRIAIVAHEKAMKKEKEEEKQKS